MTHKNVPLFKLIKNDSIEVFLYFYSMNIRISGSKERRLIQDALRKTGMTNWNKNADLNKNEMITSRRPGAKFGSDSTRFKIWSYCNGSYTRLSLRNHVKYNCPQKPIVKAELSKQYKPWLASMLTPMCMARLLPLQVVSPQSNKSAQC